MKSHPVLEALARSYERSEAGRTGKAVPFVRLELAKLLADADCSEGERRAVAEQVLIDAENIGILKRIAVTPRDPANIQSIRFLTEKEGEFYAMLSRPSPTQTRAALAEQFIGASKFVVPDEWRDGWEKWCQAMAAAAAVAASVEPFDRRATEANRDKLSLLPKLLAWEGEFPLRIASCDLCGDSKTLERLAPELGRLLEAITSGRIKSLDDVGLLPNPRSVLIHGPLELRFENGAIDFEILRGPARISIDDIAGAAQINSRAARCLTIENETTFHEIARLRSGTLLICTSYPGAATVGLIRRLPEEIEYWHFGDSDEAGFEILRSLQEKTGRDFKPLHMVRGRIPFEQESLGRPRLPTFPFY
jgi:hypothetical protein